MQGTEGGGDARCSRCGVVVLGRNSSCENCGGRRDGASASQFPSADRPDDLITYGFSLDRPSQFVDLPVVNRCWSMIVAGAALLAAVVLLFSISISLIGSAGAWLAGLISFVLGSVALACFFNRDTGRSIS